MSFFRNKEFIIESDKTILPNLIKIYLVDGVSVNHRQSPAVVFRTFSQLSAVTNVDFNKHQDFEHDLCHWTFDQYPISPHLLERVSVVPNTIIVNEDSMAWARL